MCYTRYPDEYAHLTGPSGRPSAPLSPALVARSPDVFEDIQPILPQHIGHLVSGLSGSDRRKITWFLVMITSFPSFDHPNFW